MGPCLARNRDKFDSSDRFYRLRMNALPRYVKMHTFDGPRPETAPRLRLLAKELKNVFPRGCGRIFPVKKTSSPVQPVRVLLPLPVPASRPRCGPLNPLDGYILRCRIKALIVSFKCGETEKIWRRRFSRKLPGQIQEKALHKLQLLDAAVRLENLSVPPGNRLEALRGDRKGQHSIRINQQWRICFKWVDGNAHEVEMVDYH
jgi:proteic killer suppression protein